MNGWPFLELGEICEVLDSKRKPITKAVRTSGSVPYYGATGILDFVEGYIFDEKLVLLGEDGAKWGAGENSAFIIEGKTWVNNHAHVLRPNRNLVLDEWLAHYLCATDLSEYISGVTVPKLNQGKMRTIPIPVPPLRTQQSILEKLNEVVSSTADENAALKTEILNAGELAQAVLADKLMNIEGAKPVPLKQLAELRGRIGWKGLTAKEYVKEGPRFLSVHSLNYGHYVGFQDAFNITQERYDESPEIMLQKDDILICKDGAGIGKLGMVPELLGPTTINSSMLLIRANESVFHEYLYFYLLSPMFKSVVQERLSGSTTPHLYQRDIAELSVLLPSLEAQHLLVEKIWQLFELQEEIALLAKKKIELLEEFRNSFVWQCFQGGLDATQ